MPRKPHMEPICLWHAHIDTAHFSFDAYATTKQEVKATMRGLFDTHCEQYTRRGQGGKPNGTSMWADYSDGIQYTKVELGAGYRDREKLYSILD